MGGFYDDDDLDIHVRSRGRSPATFDRPPMRYVEGDRPRSYYDSPRDSGFLGEQRLTVLSRSRSRERLRDSPPRPAPPTQSTPVIINNRFYNDASSDDDDRQLARPTRRRRSPPLDRTLSRSDYMSREEWEAENMRRQFEELRMKQEREEQDRRTARQYQDEFELEKAMHALNEIKDREARALEKKRIMEEIEHKRLEDEKAAANARAEREALEKQAVEKYKRDEQERIIREQREREERERQYKLRLVEDLRKSGLDDAAIAAILKNEKVPTPKPATPKTPATPQVVGSPQVRPTYTRMARRHLSIETLRTYRVDYDVDDDFIIIKRPVPEWEQDQFWKHTQLIREKRSGGGTLIVEEKKHRRNRSADPSFEWVRKKDDVRRSRSPSLLMWMAGARPA